MVVLVLPLLAARTAGAAGAGNGNGNASAGGHHLYSQPPRTTGEAAEVFPPPSKKLVRLNYRSTPWWHLCIRIGVLVDRVMGWVILSLYGRHS